MSPTRWTIWSCEALSSVQDQPGDRRVVILSLTPLGTDVRRRIRDSFRHLVTESLSNLAEEELELLDRGLHSLGKAIDQMRPENP